MVYLRDTLIYATCCRPIYEKKLAKCKAIKVSDDV